MQKPSASGQQQLANLLREIQQKHQSGSIFYIVRDGSRGKIKVNQGALCDITYQDKPNSTSHLIGLERLTNHR